jgi:hypothetical protein
LSSIEHLAFEFSRRLVDVLPHTEPANYLRLVLEVCFKIDQAGALKRKVPLK